MGLGHCLLSRARLTSKANASGAFRADMNMVGSAWHEGQGSDGTFSWIEDASGDLPCGQ